MIIKRFIKIFTVIALIFSSVICYASCPTSVKWDSTSHQYHADANNYKWTSIHTYEQGNLLLFYAATGKQNRNDSSEVLFDMTCIYMMIGRNHYVYLQVPNTANTLFDVPELDTSKWTKVPANNVYKDTCVAVALPQYCKFGRA